MTVHIAGADVLIGERWLRQRCSWCGAKLLDYDLAMIATPVGQDPTPATWPIGGLVRVEGNGPTVYSVVDHEDGDRLPADSCVTVELDAAETARMEAALAADIP